MYLLHMYTYIYLMSVESTNRLSSFFVYPFCFILALVLIVLSPSSPPSPLSHSFCTHTRTCICVPGAFCF